eukprot:4860765-Pleurochrysis_carterae.AAC.1
MRTVTRLPRPRGSLVTFGMATAALCLQSWSRTLTLLTMTATAMTPPTMTVLRQVALMSAP